MRTYRMEKQWWYSVIGQEASMGEHEEWIALEQYGGNSNIICFLISGWNLLFFKLFIKLETVKIQSFQKQFGVKWRVAFIGQPCCTETVLSVLNLTSVEARG